VTVSIICESSELICRLVSFFFAALSAADRAGLVNVLKVRTPTSFELSGFPSPCIFTLYPP